MGMDEFPSRLRVRSVYECLRRNGRIHEVCRILVKEADESGVEGPSKSSNCSLFSLQSGMEEEEEGWKGRRALPVQSVCRVTIVEKCSSETRRKNRLAMGKNAIGYEKRGFLSSPCTRDAYARTSRVATINRSLILGRSVLRVWK